MLGRIYQRSHIIYLENIFDNNVRNILKDIIAQYINTRDKEDPHAEWKNESPNLHKNMIIQTTSLYDRQLA